MRIDELKKEVESLGKICDVIMVVEEKADYLFIKKCEPRGYSTIATVSLKNEFRLNTNTKTFEELPRGLKEELLNILTKFARTPVDEREEVKKYQYRLKEKYWWIVEDINRTYLNWIIDEEGAKPLTINDRYEADGFKTSFTDKAIEEVAKKHGVDLNMFEKKEAE